MVPFTVCWEEHYNAAAKMVVLMLMLLAHFEIIISAQASNPRWTRD